MKFTVNDGFPDGLTLRFNNVFCFETYEELLGFVVVVEKLYRKKDKND